MRGLNVMNNETFFRAGFPKPADNIFTIADLPCAHVIEQPRCQIFTLIGHLGLTRPLPFCIQLGAPVRQLHQLLTIRRAGIGPSEPRIQKILICGPDRAAREARRIRVIATDMTIGPQHPARCQDIDLEPPGMRMRRCENGRFSCVGNAGKGHVDPETQR